MMIVLRRDLSRDYHVMQDVLQTVRGQVACVATARGYYTGRIEIHCAFDDFVADTPLNRLLKAAAREVSRSPLLSADTRRDALRVVARLEEISDLHPHDMFAVVDRRTWYYRDAIALAKHILRCVGRTFAAGGESAWTFLVRTPELVEAGVRETLRDVLCDLDIRKFPAPIVGATFGAHPDIVVGSGHAVGDVKYKVTDGSWYRPDLYEVVAFAAAFRCRDAVLITFALGDLPIRSVGLGDTTVVQVVWNCAVDPDTASAKLCDSIRTWTYTLRTHIGTAQSLPIQ
jgi:5-methylcytosine-specific restriction endonuclease McrBC regulatory subunit McrC